MALRRIIGLSLTVLSTLVFASVIALAETDALAESPFSDVPENPLYTPHIESLYNAHFITGDTQMGVPSGTFRPDDTINRAEFTKITTIIRLAELYGINESWNGKPELEILEKVNDKLQYFYKCDNTDTSECSLKKGADITNICNVCTSIGGTPFTDVAEKKWGCEEEGICDPWFTQYVYYAVAKGFIKGYSDSGSGCGSDCGKSFKPYNQIPRIYALKMILADNGNITPESDERFQSLEALADSRSSTSPKCLRGAEDYIRDNNGGDTDESNKLLRYAVLADRLDLFGNDCSVFGNNTTPKQRADFLQKSLTRKEAPRYYALTTSYYPISTSPESDPTVNTASENKGKSASFSYSIPPYGEAGKVYVPEKKEVKTVTESPVKTVGETVEPKTEVIVQTQESATPENPLPNIVATSTSGIALYDEYGASCGTIPANEEFNVLVVRKGSDGKFYQYTDFDNYRTCRFPCDKLMTPACRDVINMNAVATGEGVQTEVVAMNVNDFFPVSSLKTFVPKKYLDAVDEMRKKIESAPKITSKEKNNSYDAKGENNNTIEKLIAEFSPCGTAESNANPISADGKQLVRITNFDKNCSLETEWAKTSIYSYRYRGVMQGEQYWQKMKQYLIYKIGDRMDENAINQAVNKEKNRRNVEYDPGNSGLNIVDMKNVYNFTHGEIGGLAPEYVILHRTGSRNLSGSITTWAKATADGEYVSANYFIDENGTIYKLFDDNTVAYHAGDLFYKSEYTNAKSIGVEMTGNYTGDAEKNGVLIKNVWDDLTKPQEWAITGLVLNFVNKYNAIKSGHICPHEKVSRKTPNEGGWYQNVVLQALQKHYDKNFQLCD